MSGPFDSRGFPLQPPSTSPHMQDSARRNADLLQRYKNLARHLELVIGSERAYLLGLRRYESQVTMNTSPWINMGTQLDAIAKLDFTMERLIRADMRLAMDKARDARDTGRLIAASEDEIARLERVLARVRQEINRVSGVR